MPIILISTDFLRDQLNKSVKQETMFSKTAMIVVKAAKNRKIKNNPPHNCPSGILLKIFGRVTKIKPKPLSGFTPKAKQAGKMISPETKATKVSSKVMLMLSPSNERSLSM